MRSAPEPSLLALVLVTGVSPFATDTYIAALPEVQRTLSTTPAVAQLTMTAFILGLAAGQLICGPLSDGLGRRKLLILSSVAFAVLSAVCALAPSAGLLLGARALEGFAGGCGMAVGRAVISDRWSGADAAAKYGSLAAVTFLTPIIAPAVGGVILSFGDWRTVFTFLTLLGALMTLGALAGIPETLPPARRTDRGLPAALRRMGGLLRVPAFVSVVAVQCLATAGFFTYIGGSSIVLQERLGLSQSTYTVLFASNAAAMAVTSLAFRLLVRRVGPSRLRTAGLVVSASSMVVLSVCALVFSAPLAVTWVLLGVMVAGMGLTLPASIAMAQHLGRATGGTASALQGGLSFGVGAAATPLTGLLGLTTVAGLATISAVLFGGAVLALVLTRPVLVYSADG